MSEARPRPTFWPLLLIGAALRLVNLHAPVLGVHSWRQADTAAIARNAFEAGLPLWLPQVDWGGASSGFAETDPPLYSQAVAWLYGWFGVQEWLARSLSLALSLLALWLLMRLGQRLLGADAGWWGGLLFAVLPLSVFYGRSIQPESLLLACSDVEPVLTVPTCSIKRRDWAANSFKLTRTCGRD